MAIKVLSVLLVAFVGFSVANAQSASKQEAQDAANALYEAILNSDLNDYSDIKDALEKLTSDLGGTIGSRNLSCVYRDLYNSSHDGYFVYDSQKSTYYGDTGGSEEDCTRILKATRRFTCGYRDLYNSGNDGYFVYDLVTGSPLGDKGVSADDCIESIESATSRYACAYRDLYNSGSDGFYVYDTLDQTYLYTYSAFSLESCKNTIPK